jgi:8-oxo-dGTP pyrophosphatase MutT (NUDIX family)
MAKPYVTSREAAEAVGVGLSTLQAWAARGIVTPAWRTPGGQARWDVDDLRRQLGMPDKRVMSPHPGPLRLPRPAIVAAIVTSTLGVLVGRRNDGKPPWTFIAGEVEPGESAEDAAVREVKEETGCLIGTGEVIGERDHPATGRHMIYMAGHPTHGTDIFVGDEAELAEVRWASLAEADELLPGMYSPVRDYLARTIGGQAS